MHRSFTSGVIVAVLSCLIRPTAGIFWVPVLALHLYRLPLNEKLIYTIKLAAVGYITILVSRFSYQL